MKTTVFYLFFGLSTLMISQNPTIKFAPSDVTFHPATFKNSTCLSDLQRQQLQQEIAFNKQIILQTKPNAFQHKGPSPLFIIPLRPKAGFEDYGYYIINNQVDHDPIYNNHLLDYECGARTYDWASGNHGGTDYVLWPYPWKRMQEQIMEVIAAAPGIIINKRDGYFDLNCVNNGNPLWNGIVLEHADGSQTIYMHFKDGAITTKEIGDSVAEGEYLGSAGSSGSSTIPHLHFEVHDANGDLIDPYEGACNTLNATSWFADQPEYFVPEINHLSTHNSTNFDTDCGVVENTYEELNFEPGETIHFRIFYRDIQTGAETHIVVRRPDNSILYDYGFTSPWPTYTGAYAQWDFPVDGTWPDGVYTITADFGGNSYETIFGINTTLGQADIENAEIAVYPNPTSNSVHLEANDKIKSVLVFDVLGRKVLENNPNSQQTILKMEGLKVGLYILKITVNGKTSSYKIVKK